MRPLLAALFVACAGLQPAHADDLTLDAARQALAAAHAAATRLKAPGGSIAIVDTGGHLVMLERLDGSFPASAAVAIEKARTAAVFRMPTRTFEDAVNKGRTALVAVDVMLPLRGGVPLTRSGRVVGAVGVSGAASAQQDDEIADAVAQAFSAAPMSATMPAGAGSCDIGVIGGRHGGLRRGPAAPRDRALQDAREPARGRGHGRGAHARHRHRLRARRLGDAGHRRHGRGRRAHRRRRDSRHRHRRRRDPAAREGRRGGRAQRRAALVQAV